MAFKFYEQTNEKKRLGGCSKAGNMLAWLFRTRSQPIISQYGSFETKNESNLVLQLGSIESGTQPIKFSIDTRNEPMRRELASKRVVIIISPQPQMTLHTELTTARW